MDLIEAKALCVGQELVHNIGAVRHDIFDDEILVVFETDVELLHVR